MHKFVNKIHIIVFYFILLSILFFELLTIQIPITYSFSAKAEKVWDNYYFVTTLDIQNLQDKQMYVSANKNEMVMKVGVKQEGNRLYFKNQEPSFEDNYNQIYTYEIVTGHASLMECIFSKGGKTNE